MGTVYEAEQERPRRRVAVKVLRPSPYARDVKRRFENEAELLARLKHPNIARVFEAGTYRSDFGPVPWIALELVEDARPITGWANEQDLDLRGRIELCLDVCDAVHHGHQRGVIHRDLKPGNILVGADGVPKVIDFGVARVTSGDGEHTMTGDGQVIGTPRYMSPEQCGGDPAAVDTRTDVYALGVVLFELLTGELPFEARSTSAFELARLIQDQPPRRPAAVRPELAGDLDAIVLRCLAKRPEDRYASADALRQELRRHLDGEAVEARRHLRGYVLRRTLARHRVAVAIAAAFLVVIVGAAAGLAVLYGRSETNRLRAEERAEALRARDYANSIALARQALDDSNVLEMRALLDRCPPDLRGWEWRHLRAMTDDSVAEHDLAHLRGIVLDGGEPIEGLDDQWPGFALSDDERRLAVTGPGGVICIWDLSEQRLVRRLEGHDFAPSALQFSSDGSRLAAREGQPWTSPVLRLGCRNGASRAHRRGHVPIRSCSAGAGGRSPVRRRRPRARRPGRGHGARGRSGTRPPGDRHGRGRIARRSGGGQRGLRRARAPARRPDAGHASRGSRLVDVGPVPRVLPGTGRGSRLEVPPAS